MPSAFDVAALVRNELGDSVPRMKLQKLLYYAHAWSVVWDGAPLFHERIEAWMNGTVVFGGVGTSGSVRSAARSHLDRVGCGTPSSVDNPDALLAVGPSIRCTAFDLKLSVYSFILYFANSPRATRLHGQDFRTERLGERTTPLTQGVYLGEAIPV